MAQFIYLSLLLATIHLPLVKVTITCHSDGNGKAECDCFPCNGNRHHDPVITNLRQDNGTYLCSDSHPLEDQCHKKANDCTKLDLQVDVDVASPATEECWNLCTLDSTCQYIKFYWSDKKCFLISSRYNMMARLSTYNASRWSSLRNCNVGTNDSGVSSSSDTSDVTDDADTTPVNPSTEGLNFIEEEKSWIYALEHCYGRTSSLVEITNITVWNAVKSLLQNKTELQKGVWIGLERSIFGKPDRPWKWISGCVAKDNAPPWNSSLVDPLNNHCGKIIRDEKSEELKWGDGDCHDKLPFICQGKLNCFP
ncbi:uncharacterized protein LOC119491815 [Sebastes umbrosus]|uniref:uncharacterized protein LOC119491815 n=1 Tax=Sebastes umbrosus TaxID=72105 RepID=UPI0018A10590|nr:uncharacterized protein LOC119491815 [Sebastes umbrosus]